MYQSLLKHRSFTLITDIHWFKSTMLLFIFSVSSFFDMLIFTFFFLSELKSFKILFLLPFGIIFILLDVVLTNISCSMNTLTSILFNFYVSGQVLLLSFLKNSFAWYIFFKTAILFYFYFYFFKEVSYLNLLIWAASAHKVLLSLSFSVYNNHFQG